MFTATQRKGNVYVYSNENRDDHVATVQVGKRYKHRQAKRTTTIVDALLPRGGEQRLLLETNGVNGRVRHSWSTLESFVSNYDC